MRLPEWMDDQVRRDSSDFSLPGTLPNLDPYEPTNQSFAGISVYLTGTQIVPSGNNDVIDWDAKAYDTTGGQIWSTTAPSRLYVTKSGFWRVMARVSSDADGAAASRTDARIRKNASGSSVSGTQVAKQRLVSTTEVGGWESGFEQTVSLNFNEYVELFIEAVDEQQQIQSGVPSGGGTFFMMNFLAPFDSDGVN